MGGTPGGTLTPLAGVEPLVSNTVTLTAKRPPFSAYFNRGIVATQALSHALNDQPSIRRADPAHPGSGRSHPHQADGSAFGGRDLAARSRRQGRRHHPCARYTSSMIPRDLRRRRPSQSEEPQRDPRQRAVRRSEDQGGDRGCGFRQPRRAEGGRGDGDRPPPRQGEHPAQQIHGAERRRTRRWPCSRARPTGPAPASARRPTTRW